MQKNETKKILSPPDWVQDAVFYQIFPERFANGDTSNDPPNVERWGNTPKPNNYFGGDLKGILDKLEYLKDLGVNALYLNPIFSAHSNHKYNIKDYFSIDSSFGTNKYFDQFIFSCHESGFKVVLDGVFNHVGTAFFAFEDVVKNGRDSRYASWFNIFWFPVQPPSKPNYECWWGYGSLPKLMVMNPEVKQYLFDIAKYWTPRIDGWRLDVPNEIPHKFWKEWRRYVKELNEQCYLTGELWQDAGAWLEGDEFDGVMNYRFRQSCLDYFASDKISLSEFDDSLANVRNEYSDPHNFALQNLLGSHDTERIKTLCRNEQWRVKLTFFFQMTYLGAPMIYYGDEIGMEGGKDPDCRRTMIWDEKEWDSDLHSWIKKLIAIRNSSPALRRGTFERIKGNDKKNVYLFKRKYHSHTAYVAFNKSTRAVKEELTVENNPKELTEQLSGRRYVPVHSKIQITIPPRSGIILTD
ncbi:MAG: glycoside hydrolase family 13 protein [Bacteroidetes bacterium]|nr:glycoside hydrolase family 13 protein [Bacteroidota bacterium]